jgi:hypothetical protein
MLLEPDVNPSPFSGRTQELKLLNRLWKSSSAELLILYGRRRVGKTRMLTHGQSESYIQYIDPESHTIRSYYPDFLFQKEDSSYVIVEVKGDNKIDDPVVLAKKEFAEQMAIASGMTYKIIRGSDVNKDNYTLLFGDDPSLIQASFAE